ncbi:52 kDa repressor of the inhibitor of the protein kinase-like [Acyrthosiphon pisum]|uniref:Repressor of the inhibitor of the protein kinase n=2 Tax=Acyrthosiphon pisum TaxID=7029 RepID=A0A8R2JUU0_ACYPI|nr:52 kDa repressor of the inhibitor of the protein kinase-like [Acyrthosiphon pisum]
MYGQGYDGASNMAGKFKRVQTIIRNKYPMALYVHCAAHTLNLAVSSSCEQQDIRNCLGVVEKMHCFFNTPKRHSILLEAVANSDFNPSSKSLKRLCVTRWVERYTAVNDFVELFPCVVEALEKISTTFNDKSSTDASMLLKSMDSEFLTSIQVVKVVLSYGLPLCKCFQKYDIDLKEAVQLAECNVSMLEDLRQNIEKEFKSMYKEAEKMADFLDINISIKRISKKQTNRANIFSEDKTIQPETYNRITIAIPYIDYFINNLKERFLVHENILKGFQCIFSGNIVFQEFEELVNFYLDTDVQTVIAELKIWQSKLNITNKYPTIAIDALRLYDSSVFPNVHQLLKILCTLPVSTSTPERT